MAWTPTLLEDSLDPWLAIEPDANRRRMTLEFLVDLCPTAGHCEWAVPVPGAELPAFAAAVAGADVVLVWVIAEQYEQLAIRYLFDIRRGQQFGG